MPRFQFVPHPIVAEPATPTLRAARLARWIAGGALNLFALGLVVSQIWPSLSA